MEIRPVRRWVLAAVAGSVTAGAAFAPSGACAVPIDYDGVSVGLRASPRDRAGRPTAIDRLHAAPVLGTVAASATPTATPLPPTPTAPGTRAAAATARVRTATVTGTPPAQAAVLTGTPSSTATRTGTATATRTSAATVNPPATGTASAVRTRRPLPDTTTGIHVFNDQLSNLSPGRIGFAVSHYDGTQKMTRADADALRAANPNFVILHYRLGHGLGDRTPDAGCAPTGGFLQIIDGTWVQEWPGDAVVQETWFFHQNAQRVFQCTWGWYLMELDDAGWRQWWSDAVLGQMAANDDDGLFADSLSVPNYLGASDFNPTLPAIDAAFESAWSGRIARFLTYLQGRFAGRYYLIPNVGYWVTGRDATDYSAADGVMIEGFGYDAWTAFSAADWALQMDRVLGLINQGKAVIGQAYHTESADTRLFTLASYLLIKGTHTYVNLDIGLDPEWWPEYGIPIGAPLAPPPANVEALLDASTGVYTRAYTNGLVVVNTGASSHTVPLGGTYYLAQPSGGGTVPGNGVLPAAWTVAYAPMTSVTLAPGHAALLVLDPGGAPTPTPTVTRAASATVTMTSTGSPTRTASATATVPAALALDAIPAPLVVGGTTVLTGSGFTAGSVIVVFVATSGGPASFGPYSPRPWTPNALTWAVPATLPLGNGFATVLVVNTDQGFVQSNPQSQLLRGAAVLNIPTILGVNGVGVSAFDPNVPLAYVGTVLVPGGVATISGTGFSGPLVNLFTSSGNLGPLAPQPGGSATQFQIAVPSNAPTGPGSLQVVNSPYLGNVVSNAVSVPIGATVGIDGITQSGTAITVRGSGFSTASVLNLFNRQGSATVNLGGLDGQGRARIPLTSVTPTQLTFAVPAGAVAGSAYLQVINPPFIAASSSGNDPDGAFVLVVP